MHLKPVSTVIFLTLIGCAAKEGASSDSVDSGAPEIADYDDEDNDGIIDGHDGTEDSDDDGVANFLDTDSDDDGILDSIEAGDEDIATLPIDSDQDGLQDFVDTDSDNNCIFDSVEGFIDGSSLADTDGDGKYDYADSDNDGDGISDIHEIRITCEEPDSDADGTPDYMDIDSDNDGIADLYEGGTTEWDDDPKDTDEDGIPDYLDDDSDGDNIPDKDEGPDDPTVEPADTDGDGDYDFADTDADGDSLPDWDEINIHGTDPYDPDSDGDSYTDGSEIIAGTDPSDPGSIIEGVYVTVPERTDVENPFSFELRIQMGDVAFLLDTTCSMSGTANAMASEFSSIVSALNSLIPDAEYGFATYDDYAYGSYGSGGAGDRPFILLQQITDNTSSVQAELSAVTIHAGADGPESTMEALYQAAYGKGYDQNCNGIFDTGTDVKPFLTSADDAFAGTGGQSYSSSSSGGGFLGGFGFRENALPVMVYATDNELRDPESGYGTPGGCPIDAGGSDVINAINEIGGYTIGILSSSWSTSPLGQMEAIASATGSMADTDSDGSADDLLVFEWTSSSAEFRSTVVDAIEDLINSIRFSRVELEVEGDEWGFVTSIEPPYYEDIDPSDTTIDALDFRLNFLGVVPATSEDQLYALTLNVIGDENILLDTQDIIVVVPGTSL